MTQVSKWLNFLGELSLQGTNMLPLEVDKVQRSTFESTATSKGKAFAYFYDIAGPKSVWILKPQHNATVLDIKP